tara:strand:- start:178 stop:495 length:318 start_codon:yes stop_codon:yes gene_type:complete
MMTITVEIDMDCLTIEADGDYWRDEPDEKVRNLTLYRLLVAYQPNCFTELCRVDLLQGLNAAARRQVEQNLFALPNITSRLIERIEEEGEAYHFEPDYDPHEDED